MKIRPVTVLKCIFYPAAAVAARTAAGLYYHRTRQALRGDPSSEQPEQSLAGAPISCIEAKPLSDDDKMRLAKEARQEAHVLIEMADELSRGGQVISGSAASIGTVLLGMVLGGTLANILAKKKRQRAAKAMRQKAEELLKQAEKWEREALEESGAVTPPAASETDTESQAADSESHS